MVIWLLNRLGQCLKKFSEEDALQHISIVIIIIIIIIKSYMKYIQYEKIGKSSHIVMLGP